MTAIKWVLIGFGLLVLAVIVLQVSDGMRPIIDHGSHTSFSTDVGGTAAFYRLVEDSGYEVSRSDVPYAQIAPGPGVFIMVTAANAKECPT